MSGLVYYLNVHIPLCVCSGLLAVGLVGRACAGAEGVDDAEVKKIGSPSWSPRSKRRGESWTQMIIRIKSAQQHGTNH